MQLIHSQSIIEIYMNICYTYKYMQLVLSKSRAKIIYIGGIYIMVCIYRYILFIIIMNISL